MRSGGQTPLFDWPISNSETWDPITSRHVYPSSKVVPQAANAVQHLRDIEQRVTAVLNAIGYNTGDIHRMIAEDLASPAAERELALLPRTDYYSVKYASCISKGCKTMLQDKIKRYQRQRAHNLARDKMVDIVLKWQCSAHSPQPVRMLQENEIAYVNIAYNCRYKYLDWNLEHAEEKEEDGSEPDPGECRKPRRADPSIPYPPASHKGGFYACVVQDLLPFLEKLSDAWTASVQVVIHPRLMTEYEQLEMGAYHAARRQAEDALSLGKALETIKEERAAEENEELKRMKARHDYPREELIERETENLLRQDPVNYTPIGTYW